MGTLDGIQYPGSLLKKFLKGKLKKDCKLQWFPIRFFSMWKAKSQIDTTENSQIPQLISFSIVIIRVQAAKKISSFEMEWKVLTSHAVSKVSGFK